MSLNLDRLSDIDMVAEFTRHQSKLPTRCHPEPNPFYYKVPKPHRLLLSNLDELNVIFNKTFIICSLFMSCQNSLKKRFISRKI